MSRTYANFLLFEDILGSLPEDTALIMNQAVDMLLNPSVKFVEEDCGTLLGKVVETNYEIEGLTSLATGIPLSRSYINSLLSFGTYTVRVRDLHTCNSHLKGGICRTCYAATFIGETAPAVGTNTSIPSKLIYQSDVIVGNNYSTTFMLSQNEDEWYDVIVIKNGVLVDPLTYTLNFDSITFTSVLPINEVYVVHFLQENTEPFLGYISKTYSGGLLGIEALPTLPTLLRESLYSDMFSDTFVGLMLEEVATIKSIPSTYLDYIDRIHSKLEKVVYILFIYSIYKNLEE